MANISFGVYGCFAKNSLFILCYSRI